jgi:hypothetical protein
MAFPISPVDGQIYVSAVGCRYKYFLTDDKWLKTGLVPGDQGITGYQGVTGASGADALQGETGPAGIQGETGPAGIYGPTGIQGETGFTGHTGIQGVTGASGSSSSGIGPAEEGDYTDGLFVDFVPTTPVGTAVDRFNEVLKSLAPPPAPSLTYIGMANTGVAGKLSFGASNAIAGYTDVPSKDINSSVGTSESITDGPHTVVLKGIFNASTNMSGNLADSTTQGSGSPTPAYPAKAFGDATVGSIQLWLNGVQVASVNLSSSTGALSDTNADAVLSVSAASAVKFPAGDDFSTFQYRTGTWQILAAAQRNGYNRVHVVRVTSGSVTTNVFGWVVDDNATATSFASESLSSLSMAGSKYLSGVVYHTSGSATYNVTISNLHRNTYSSSASAVSHAGTRSSVSSSSLGNISAESDTEIISKTATIATASRILNQGIAVTTSVDRTVHGDLTSPGSSDYALLLDATSASSSATAEGFDDEVYRIASNLNVDTTAGYSSGGSSPSEWDNTISLVSATAGYSNGLLVYNSTLVYPTKGVNSGNFSGIINGPAGNVNYSGATGNRVYLRFFYDAAPRQNFRINVTATSTSFVSVASGPSGNNLNLEILAPATTSNGSSTVWKDATVAYTNDNSVGCYSSSSGSSIPTSWGLTLGGKNTSTSGYVVVVRITASSSWSGSISAIQLTWL